jgi:o-succinylbenzoate---CoA ligase
MTECASQIATAVLGSWEQHLYPSLQILAHLQAQTTAEGRLGVRGESLLSCYAWEKEGSWKIEDPKQEGWFWTEDRGKVKGNSLAVLGRLDQVVKVGGENVDLARLEKLLQDLKLLIDLQGEVALVAYPDERLGHVLHLAVSQISEDDLQPLLDQFHQRVLPFEKIRHIHFLPLIPKSPLSKVLRQDLLTLIQKG